MTYQQAKKRMEAIKVVKNTYGFMGIIKIMALNPECDRIKVVTCSDWVVHVNKLDYDPIDEKYVLCEENGIAIA